MYERVFNFLLINLTNLPLIFFSFSLMNSPSSSSSSSSLNRKISVEIFQKVIIIIMVIMMIIPDIKFIHYIYDIRRKIIIIILTYAWIFRPQTARVRACVCVCMRYFRLLFVNFPKENIIFLFIFFFLKISI